MNLEELKVYLPILMIGATKTSYPFYGRYIASDKKVLYTCNDSVFVSINYAVPFKGAVDIYVLFNLFKRLKDVEITQIDDHINIKTWNLNTNINLDDINIPYIVKPECDTLVIDDQILEDLKLASKFSGGEFPYVYVGSNSIIGTDAHKFFHSTIPVDVKPFLLPPRLISILNVGNSIGINDTNDYIVINFENGYMLDTIQNDVNKFPIDFSLQYCKEYRDNHNHFCNASLIQEGILDVSHVLLNEKVQSVLLTNDKNKIAIKADSMRNGNAVSVCDSDIEENISIKINPVYIKYVPFDYSISINNINLVCVKDNKTIIIMSIK